MHGEERLNQMTEGDNGRKERDTGEQRSAPCTSRQTSGLLDSISEEKEEVDDGVLKWRISDVFNEIHNDSPKNDRSSTPL